MMHLLGLDDASGPFYLFWSGVGSFVFMAIAFIGHHIAIKRHISKELKK